MIGLNKSHVITSRSFKPCAGNISDKVKRGRKQTKGTGEGKAGQSSWWSWSSEEQRKAMLTGAPIPLNSGVDLIQNQNTFSVAQM